MGILRTDKISGLETPTAVTGSVYFDGSGDHLTVASSNDFEFGGNVNFTIEFWINLSDNSRVVGTYSQTPFCIGGEQCRIYINGTDGVIGFKYRTTNTQTSFVLAENKWEHIALVRNNGVISLYHNGNADSNTLADTATNTVGDCVIGAFDASNGNILGYISNLRILKGTALYTADFTPPTHELEVIGDTVLLCCNNPDSAAAASYASIGTSKTITVNGDAAASTVSPGLTRDFTFGTEFEGVSKFDTQGYFVPPSGTTEQQFPNFGAVDAASARGVFAGGLNPSPTTRYNTLEYITISTTGNTQDFGDLSYLAQGTASLASSTRGVFGGASDGSANLNTMDFITISSTGNASSFGDLTRLVRASTGASNSTRGLFNGGYNPTLFNVIDYITISTQGNAQDFGDSTFSGAYKASFGSSTRSIFGGGFNPSATDIIEFVTIATTSNATDFGDLSGGASDGKGGCSSSTRGIFAGGSGPAPSRTPGLNSIEFITISSLGSAQSFGDLTQRRRDGLAACSSSTRGVFAGGLDGPPNAVYNIIDYVTIATTGNAVDFGDLSAARAYMNGGASNGHGGLS